MTVYLATKTLQAIDDMLEDDQGAKYRGILKQVIPHIGDAYDSKKQDFRNHMGASGIGKECTRAIWYDFRWYTASQNSARMIRLFNRGHLEEARFIALLLAIGVQVYQQDQNGKQFRIQNPSGHFGGSGDGVAMGIPDIPPGRACLLEFKTSADKQFKEMQVNGVKEAKPEHYIQTCQYMTKMNIDYTLYMVVNKNTDELYGEIVLRDDSVEERYSQLAERLIAAHYPPPKLNASPGYFKCKNCNHHGVCHTGREPARNCRTCRFSSPMVDTTSGEWVCMKFERAITPDQQRAACDSYEVKR